jgi:hypothetical protein
MSRSSLRKSLSAPGLLCEVRRCFQSIKDDTVGRGFELADYLMSGLAVFGLKYPSLLQFDEGRADEVVVSNLRSLYGIARAPSDTALRERLDGVDPSLLRRAFRRVLHLLQRGRGLEDFLWWAGHYLLSVDGTGYFYSDRVHCGQCCEKHHRDGRVSWYHQLLGAVLVHPEQRVVLPLAPEPIVREDGTAKNDCERNAAKRLLADVRREHPHLKLIVVEDALAANGPHIKLLQSLRLRYILGVKPGDHTFLFDRVATTPGVATAEITDKDGTVHRFRYLNGAPLNETHFELAVNFLDYEEQRRNGKSQRFTWVTDIPLHQHNLLRVMRGARARWKIENETFNTLKNQGYHFEHNFGHGYQHLSTVFAHLMMLAFLVDQVQQHCCGLFQAALAKQGRKRYFWEKLRSFFFTWLLPDWETLYRALAYGSAPTTLVAYDTS